MLTIRWNVLVSHSVLFPLSPCFFLTLGNLFEPIGFHLEGNSLSIHVVFLISCKIKLKNTSLLTDSCLNP